MVFVVVVNTTYSRFLTLLVLIGFCSATSLGMGCTDDDVVLVVCGYIASFIMAAFSWACFLRSGLLGPRKSDADEPLMHGKEGKRRLGFNQECRYCLSFKLNM